MEYLGLEFQPVIDATCHIESLRLMLHRPSVRGKRLKTASYVSPFNVFEKGHLSFLVRTETAATNQFT